MSEAPTPLTRLPRDSAGSLDLDGGTGGITAMCSCGEFLEVYKQDVTFRIKTPETIDPGRTNPHAPFVAAVADTVGSSSPAVARVLLQGRDIVEAVIFERQVDKAGVVQALHSCKEAIVACEKVALRVGVSVDAIIEEIRTGGVKRDRGGALNPFPQVIDLDSDTTAFLINAKRAIQLICRLPATILGVPPKDSNFDHLANTLEASVGKDAAVTHFVRKNAPAVRYLIELRNWQEHPNAKRTVVANFSVAPDGSLTPPTWHVTGEAPQPVRDEMFAGVDFLVDIAEAMLIHLVMHAADKRIPFIIVQVDPAHADPALPMRYRLSIDPSRLTLGQGTSN